LKLISSKADAVITSTIPLQQSLKKFNANVFCIHNALSEDLWLSDQAPTAIKGNKPIRILYMGTRTHREDLEVITDAWKQINEEYKDQVTLDIIGGTPADELEFGNPIEIPQPLIYPDFVQWLKQQGSWDIGLIPLKDTEFNRKKSHIKFLDYSALGLPIICSKVTAYQNVAVDGENALMVNNTTDEWYQAIKRLIEDEQLRGKLAAEAYSSLRTKYCLQQKATDWIDTYRNVLNG
jgi:glycosyltransferase involved in cell wall biosynthesis